MINSNSGIGTLAAEIKNDKRLIDENVVKVITETKLEKNNFPTALNFTRDGFSRNDQNIYHHIGIYSYKTSTLKKFVSLDQTFKEKKID
jgi:3-deoxy-manno-octulosonate cytidylyltransferase (CMP-KDO synthetase)